MFAPYTASSLWMRSPIVVASASIAVTAVVPSRIATPASILRRRCLRKLSISRRKNISVPLPFPSTFPSPFPSTLKDRSKLAQICGLNHHLSTPHTRLQRNRIAPALLPHRRCVQRRGAHLARNPLVSDIETHRPTDLASIRNRNNRPIRLLEEQKTNLDVTPLAVVKMHAIAMQLVVVHIRRGQGHLRPHQRHRRSRRQGSRALRVNKLRRRKKDKQKARRNHGTHPHLLAPLAPLCPALVRSSSRRTQSHRRTPLVLHQHHQTRQSQHRHKKEQIVANDRANQPHLGGAGRQNAVFAQLM